MLVSFVLCLLVIQLSDGTTSPVAPFSTYPYTIELQKDLADLWWTVNETNKTVLFELHIKTTGWIALGISAAGGMVGADIGVGWVEQSGTVRFQDQYASAKMKPDIDNSTDWFALQGREQNGWTAIQFTRLLDTCDPMDVAIKSGTNHLVFAYGLADPMWSPTTNGIDYHGTRKGVYSVALRSYSDPPLASKFAALSSFDFRLNNYTIPATDTTYHCQVYKVPAMYTSKQHVVANQILLDSADITHVHHLLLYECDPTVSFNDSNLPSGLCEDVNNKIASCLMNIATGWAVGGDLTSEYPSEAGYPIGANFSIKYYVVQMHYTNTHMCTNCTDSSGIRFYVTNELRHDDIGYLTFGTDPSALSLTLPAQAQNFTVDSYCPASVTSVFPATGITVLSAFPHTHLQGISIWTKVIRNKTAVEYLFNAESYDFNFQFLNRLPQRIQLYPGDEFMTRCIYQTMNRNITTFGGEKTTNEMCLHMFTYFPRMDNISACISIISGPTWKNFLKINTTFTATTLQQVAANISWTPNLVSQWQSFYNNASRATIYGRSGNPKLVLLPKLPDYIDFNQTVCVARRMNTNSVATTVLGTWHKIFISVLFSFLLHKAMSDT